MKLREFGISSLKDEYVCTCQVGVVHAKKMKAWENQKRRRCVCFEFQSILGSHIHFFCWQRPPSSPHIETLI